MKTRISKADLFSAFQMGIVTSEQAERLWMFFLEKDREKPKFSGFNVFYYFGALVVISAMTWFATEAFSKYHAIGLCAISTVYFLLFTIAGYKLYGSTTTQIPGGLFLTVAIFVTPLFVFSIQKIFNLWVYRFPGEYNDFYLWIKSGWFFMELGTIAVSIVYLMKFKFPFMTFPLAFTIWFLSMDATPIIFGIENFSADQRKAVSIIFGVGMLILAYSVDGRTVKDYAFWLYFFGATSVWTGLTLLESTSEVGKFIYCCINVFLIFVSVMLQRKVFLVFGSIGVYWYLYHLSSVVFENSMMFPIALSIMGVSIVFLGVIIQRNEANLVRHVKKILPEYFLRALPPYEDRRGNL